MSQFNELMETYKSEMSGMKLSFDESLLTAVAKGLGHLSIITMLLKFQALTMMN